MKLNGCHTISSSGYEIWATKCTNQHKGGVALIHKSSSLWHLEGIKCFGPNTIKSTLFYGDQRITIIGTSLPPSEKKTKKQSV